MDRSRTKTTMVVKKALAPTLEQEGSSASEISSIFLSMWWKQWPQHWKDPSGNGSFLQRKGCLTVPGYAYM